MTFKRVFTGVLYTLLIVCIAVMICKFADSKKMDVAEMIPYRTEQELIVKSDLIITGKVERIGESKWSNPDLKPAEKRNVLQTDIYVMIGELLCGEYSEEYVAVRIDKDGGYPEFKLGEEVVLFLSRDDSDVATDEDYFVLTGMRQGKWNIADERITSADYGTKEISQTLAELKEKIVENKK